MRRLQLGWGGSGDGGGRWLLGAREGGGGRRRVGAGRFKSLRWDIHAAVGADKEDAPGRQEVGLVGRDPDAVDEGAVAAAKVGEDGALGCLPELGVMGGNFGIREWEDIVRGAADGEDRHGEPELVDDVLAQVDGELAGGAG